MIQVKRNKSCFCLTSENAFWDMKFNIITKHNTVQAPLQFSLLLLKQQSENKQWVAMCCLYWNVSMSPISVSSISPSRELFFFYRVFCFRTQLFSVRWSTEGGIFSRIRTNDKLKPLIFFPWKTVTTFQLSYSFLDRNRNVTQTQAIV